MDRIAYVDPGPPDATSRLLGEQLKEAKRSDTGVEYISLDRGPGHLEYRYYESLIVPDLLHKLKALEQDGFDAAVIGCFYDPGLQEAREILSDMVVTAPGEASLHIAATLGNTFSIILGRSKWIPRVRENLVHYGFANKIASFQVLDLGVLDFHDNESGTRQILLEKCREAVEKDFAEVIILGCTMQFGFFKTLQQDLGVPVIDPLISSLKYAELLAELKRMMNWRPSRKHGYEPPPLKDIRKWDLEKQYNLKGIWQAT